MKKSIQQTEASTEIEAKRLHTHQVMERALERLSGVNDRLLGGEMAGASGFDDRVEACRLLCRHLHVEFRQPQPDASRSRKKIVEEILYLSGVRHKEVALPEKWWQQYSGGMLGELLDGTVIALLPHRLSGYVMVNPKTGARTKITRKNCGEIVPRAIAAYRAFAPEKIGMRQVGAFLLGEHVWREIALIILCSLLGAIVQVIPPIMSAQIFDVIVPETLRGILLEVIFVLIAFAVADIGFSVITNLGLSRLFTKLEFSLQAAVWDRLLSLPMHFFGKHTTGGLLSRIQSIEQVRNVLSIDNLKAFLSALFAFVNVLVLFRYNAGITPYVLLLFVIAIGVYWIAGQKKIALNRQYATVDARSSSLSHQMVEGIQRVRVSGATERLFSIWSEFEAEKRLLKSQSKMIDNGLTAFREFFRIASAAVVYLLTSLSGDMPVGNFVAYIATFLILQKAILKLLKVLTGLPDLLLVAHNLQPILEQLPEHHAKKTIPKDMDGGLEVNHVLFRYSEFGRTILRDLSFRVEPGKSLGIMGLSGSGKTTLLKALLGFYPLAGGKIFYGGYDLDTIDLRYLRGRMGVVLQNGRLAIGSVYSNIADNTPEMTEEQVWAAIDAVNLRPCVEALPHGILTRLESCALSDGERQRLLIARTIARDCQYLFFDEATSRIDSASQAEILRHIHKVNATKVIIAQRLSTLQYCDKVIVLRDGQIVDQGGYAEVLKRAASTAPSARANREMAMNT
jgi:ATP-binding cassette subfamily C protein